MLKQYIAANSLDNIQVELAVLTDQLTTIRTQLEAMQQNGQLATHYTNNALAPAAEYAPERFVNTRAFFVTLPQTGHSCQQDQANYPNDFTTTSIAQKVQDEINQITALTNGIPGEGSLIDPRYQNQQLMFENVDTFLTRVAQVNANNDLELGQTINTIRALSQQVHSGRLIVEFPIDILVTYFPAQQYPNGFLIDNISIPFIQDHMAVLFPLIKQYARRLAFINYLNTNPICKNAIEYHFGRMARFLMQIPDNDIEEHIGVGNLAQWKAIRNSIQHDLEELETYGIKATQWLCHYLGTITQVLPNMLQPFIAVATPLP